LEILAFIIPGLSRLFFGRAIQATCIPALDVSRSKTPLACYSQCESAKALAFSKLWSSWTCGGGRGDISKGEQGKKIRHPVHVWLFLSHGIPFLYYIKEKNEVARDSITIVGALLPFSVQRPRGPSAFLPCLAEAAVPRELPTKFIVERTTVIETCILATGQNSF
jgi:hypothetical protein